MRKEQQEVSWDLKFRSLFEWEKEEMANLLVMLQDVSLQECREDTLIWIHGKYGVFTVKRCCELIEEKKGLPDSPWGSLIWGKEIPMKIQAFLWLALHDAIATKSFLFKRKILFDRSNFFCLWCGTTEEDKNHILVQCFWAWKIWMSIFEWWNINWVLPGSVEGILRFCNFWRKKKLYKWWRIIIAFTLWGIWEARNFVVFNKEVICWKKVVTKVKQRSLEWLLANVKKYCINSHKWAL